MQHAAAPLECFWGIDQLTLDKNVRSRALFLIPRGAKEMRMIFIGREFIRNASSKDWNFLGQGTFRTHDKTNGQQRIKYMNFDLWEAMLSHTHMAFHEPLFCYYRIIYRDTSAGVFRIFLLDSVASNFYFIEQSMFVDVSFFYQLFCITSLVTPVAVVTCKIRGIFEIPFMYILNKVIDMGAHSK